MGDEDSQPGEVTLARPPGGVGPYARTGTELSGRADRDPPSPAGRGAHAPHANTLPRGPEAGWKGYVNDVWIGGAGMTRFGRRDEKLPDLMAEAALVAMADAGIDRPDAVVVAAMNPEEFTGEGNYGSLIATRLGLSHVPALRVETATSSGVAAVYMAFAAIAAGLQRSVLVVGGEKMTHLATPRVSEIIGRSIDPHENFRDPVTLEAVMESRLVADPLRLYHCCPISDGGAALLLTVERRAVRIAGIGQGGDTLAVRYRRDLTSFRATQAAAAAAYRMAGFGAERVDVAEVHDAFTPFELISLEDTGLVPPGKAGRATLDGETAIGGRLPVNTSGGLKARGHPLAATGISQLVELCWQLTGRAEGRQVEAHVGLAQSIGGLATNNWVTLLEGRR